VQVGDGLRQQDALRVVERPLADPLARVQQRRPVRRPVAEVCVERAGAASRRRELLAVVVGAAESAEVSSVEANARDEEVHRRRRLEGLGGCVLRCEGQDDGETDPRDHCAGVMPPGNPY
jgi:hypothetical protein